MMHKHSLGILEISKPIFDGIKYFVPQEFKYPTKIDRSCLVILDHIRQKFGKPIVITGDYRPKYYRPATGAKNSLHYLGRAFDIRIRDYNQADMWFLIYTIMVICQAFNYVCQLEIVPFGRNKHLHIGFYPPTSKVTTSKLIFAPE